LQRPGHQWRYNTLFRSKTVPWKRQSPWRDHRYGPGYFQTDHQQHQVAHRRPGSFPPQALGGRTAIPQLHVHQELGRQRRVDDELLRDRGVPRQRRALGRLPRIGPHARPDAVPGARHADGNENFQQGAFLKPGPGDPYIYSFGTPSGRGGSAYLARVLPGAIPDVSKYEYWNSDSNSWVPGNPGAATPVIPGPVGEMSAQFNTYLKQYLTLYTNGANDVVEGLPLHRRDRGVPSKCWCRQCSSPAASTRRSSIPGRQQGALLQSVGVVGIQRQLMKTVLP